MAELVAPSGEIVEVSYPRWYAECYSPSYAIEVETGIVEMGELYDGPYSVTPSEEAQTLSTTGLNMEQDIVIAPIPNNYGLVTRAGANLTIT